MKQEAVSHVYEHWKEFSVYVTGMMHVCVGSSQECPHKRTLLETESPSAGKLDMHI
jgi:hypothetical protein